MGAGTPSKTKLHANQCWSVFGWDPGSNLNPALAKPAWICRSLAIVPVWLDPVKWAWRREKQGVVNKKKNVKNGTGRGLKKSAACAVCVVA